MADQSFADALNEQISNEFAAQQQYIGAAVYYDSETLPRLAAFFYRQAVEERNHAMIMVQYLLDTDEEVKIPDITCQLATRDIGDRVVIKPCINYTLRFDALHQDPPGILQENTSIPLNIICN